MVLKSICLEKKNHKHLLSQLEIKMSTQLHFRNIINFSPSRKFAANFHTISSWLGNDFTPNFSLCIFLFSLALQLQLLVPALIDDRRLCLFFFVCFSSVLDHFSLPPSRSVLSCLWSTNYGCANLGSFSDLFSFGVDYSTVST